MRSHVVIFIFFVVVLGIAIFASVDVSPPVRFDLGGREMIYKVEIQDLKELAEQEIAAREFRVRIIVRILGAFIAVIAALNMLICAVRYDSLDKIFFLLLPFLAGILLMQVHWSVPISLSVVGLAYIARTLVPALSANDAGDEKPNNTEPSAGEPDTASEIPS